MKKTDEIKELKHQISMLQDETKILHGICKKQRDSLAAQQEAIVQLNISVDSTLCCLAEKYGADVRLDSGKVGKRLTVPTSAYPGVLDRMDASVVIENDEYLITVSEKENGEAQK